MKDNVVRAGKYISVGILFIACLPVLLPLLVFLSICGFTLMLPLGCALGGLLFLRKYVGMLYRKLPNSTPGGCSSWGPQPATPEFDAVVISSAPREVQRGCIEGADGKYKKSGLRDVSIADVSVDDATRQEGIDADTVVEDCVEIWGKDRDTLVESETVREVKDNDPFAEDGTRKEGIDEDKSNDDVTRREGIDDETSVDDENRREVRDDTSDKGGTRGEAKDSTFLEDGTTREGSSDGGQIEWENGGTTPVDEGELQEVEKSKQLPGEEAEIRSERKDDDRQVMGKETETDVDEDGQLQDVVRTKKFWAEDPGNGSNHSTSLDEDSLHSGSCNPYAIGLRNVHELRKERLSTADSIHESSSRTPADYREQKWEEKPSEDYLERAAADDHNNAGILERVTGYLKQEEEVEKKGDEVENLIEEQTEKNVILNSMPSDANHEQSFPPTARPEVNEEGGEEEGVKKTLEESKEEKIEAVPDECLGRQLDEDREKKPHSSTAGAVTPDDSPDAFEEQGLTKVIGVGNLLPRQANEDDIWICKECGWKYPNAKPSAKIRRNHKKHCEVPPLKTLAPEEGMLPERFSLRNDGVSKLRMNSTSSSSLANFSQEQIGEWEIRQASNTECGGDGGKFDVIQEDPGSITEGPSSAPSEEERIHSSPCQSKDDGISPDYSTRVDFNDGAGGRDEESGPESEPFRSESFRSGPDEFPGNWASFPSVESHCENEHDQLAQFWRNVESKEAHSIGNLKPEESALLRKRGGTQT